MAVERRRTNDGAQRGAEHQQPDRSYQQSADGHHEEPVVRKEKAYELSGALDWRLYAQRVSPEDNLENILQHDGHTESQ